MAVCTFAGHREVFSSSIEADIDCALEEIIQTDDDFIFYSGGMGEFDKKCESAVRRIKRTHPERSIRLVLVLPYLTHEINRDKEYFEAYAVFAEPVNTAVEQWITKADRRESGVVKFFRNSDALSEGALFEIRFREASCVRYRTVSHGGISVKTVVMTFPAVSLDGEEYEIRK